MLFIELVYSNKNSINWQHKIIKFTKNLTFMRCDIYLMLKFYVYFINPKTNSGITFELSSDLLAKLLILVHFQANPFNNTKIKQ